MVWYRCTSILILNVVILYIPLKTHAKLYDLVATCYTYFPVNERHYIILVHYLLAARIMHVPTYDILRSK